MAGLSSFARKARLRAQDHTSNPRVFRRYLPFSESASAIITTPGLCAISRRDAQCDDGLKECWHLVAGAHRAPKSDVRCGLVRADPVAKEDGRPGCFVRPCAAANHFVRPCFRPLRITRWTGLVILTSEPVRTPLRYVSRHVEQAEVVGRELAHRSGAG